MSELPTQVNIRVKGNKLCLDHPKEELLLLCKDCNEKLVCMNCISTTHSGHNVVAIHLLEQGKFNHLQDLNTETRETKIPRISKNVEIANSNVKELQQIIQIEIKKVEDHGEYLKELVNKSTAETVSDLKEIERKILEQFKKFKLESSLAIEQLEELMKQSKEATQSDNNVLIMDVTKEFSSLTVQEPKLDCICTSVGFTKGSDAESHIKAAFGKLQLEGKQDILKLTEKPAVSEHRSLPSHMRSIERTKQGTYWFCEYNKPYLYKMEDNGPLRKMDIDVKVRDISTHPLNGQLYCIASANACKVNIVTMETTKMFTVDDPYCMAVTHNGNILISPKRGGNSDNIHR